MEKYQGVKFNHKRVQDSFTDIDERLRILNQWAYLFAQLGLTPVHNEGAYGNQSCRTGQSSFFITKSAMIPTEKIIFANFCHIVAFDEASNTFFSEGISTPSSESFLHHLLYQSQPHIQAILHGHSNLFLEYAGALNILSTQTFYPYGTRELAESAMEIINITSRFIILKDHGFIALGESIEEAGKTTLQYFSELIHLLKGR